jgi:hypothetical protein
MSPRFDDGAHGIMIEEIMADRRDVRKIKKSTLKAS